MVEDDQVQPDVWGSQCSHVDLLTKKKNEIYSSDKYEEVHKWI